MDDETWAVGHIDAISGGFTPVAVGLSQETAERCQARMAERGYEGWLAVPDANLSQNLKRMDILDRVVRMAINTYQGTTLEALSAHYRREWRVPITVTRLDMSDRPDHVTMVYREG